MGAETRPSAPRTHCKKKRHPTPKPPPKRQTPGQHYSNPLLLRPLQSHRGPSEAPKGFCSDAGRSPALTPVAPTSRSAGRSCGSTRPGPAPPKQQRAHAGARCPPSRSPAGRRARRSVPAPCQHGCSCKPSARRRARPPRCLCPGGEQTVLPSGFWWKQGCVGTWCIAPRHHFNHRIAARFELERTSKPDLLTAPVLTLKGAFGSPQSLPHAAQPQLLQHLKAQEVQLLTSAANPPLPASRCLFSPGPRGRWAPPAAP